MRRIVFLCLATLLGGCATPYQEEGHRTIMGGHANAKGPGKLEFMAFSGNGYTSPLLAQHYALYRCAELARDRGKPYFVLFESLQTTAQGRPGWVPRVGQVMGKPAATAFVLLLDAPGPGARATRDVLAELAPVVATGSIQLTGSDR